MDALASLGGMSSFAMWSALMNWRFMVSFFPTLENTLIDLENNLEGILRNVLGTWSGFLIAVVFIIAAMACSAHLLWEPIRAFAFTKWSTRCSIKVSSEIYQDLRSWATKNARFQSVTAFEALNDEKEETEINGIDFPDGEDCLEAIKQINHQQAERLSFSPTLQVLRFWHGGAYFWFTERKGTKESDWGRTVPDDSLEMHCFSWDRSTDHTKNLLRMIRNQQQIQTSSVTSVHLPQRTHDVQHWRLSHTLFKRPLNTVLLNKQADTVVSDIRCFLSRAGVQWYKDKGLPLRIGFLFAGPPGTGKSSFVFALAGHFGLPIYTLNLSAPRLTDEDLRSLFNRLPFHSIVLIEDIDATKPLTREIATQASPKSEAKDPPNDEYNSMAAAASKPNEVTLAGILNAIDGVAAQQGRILIMTTNHVEVLDEALIRPGRADRVITFTNATKDQARQMFVNAYKGPPAQQGQDLEAEHWTNDDVVRLSKCFADKIQDHKFSPALLQQYFKDFRAHPRGAVQELEEWMKDPRGYRKPVLEGSLRDIDFSNEDISESPSDSEWSLLTSTTSCTQPSPDCSSSEQEDEIKVPGGYPARVEGDKADPLGMLIEL